MTKLPTGTQYEIASSGGSAVITEVGATLRSFSVNGRDLIGGFGPDETISGGRGQQLLPWPNRIRDGRYLFEGREWQLALSEPDRHNAIHGLVRWVVWELVDHTADTVTQRVRVHPQPGWPGIVEAVMTHRVEPDGLIVDVSVTNIGAVRVPFGYAAHPYLTVGEERVDEVTLIVPASQYLQVDERLLPLQVRDVDGRPEDLRDVKPLGARDFDTAFTGLTVSEDSRWHVRLQLGHRFAELWAEPIFGWTQVFTGGGSRASGIAVEPMTCGPDAFNPGPTSDDLIVLEPGASFAGTWGIRGR